MKMVVGGGEFDVGFMARTSRHFPSVLVYITRFYEAREISLLVIEGLSAAR
jgi:hypothetical protein